MSFILSVEHVEFHKRSEQSAQGFNVYLWPGLLFCNQASDDLRFTVYLTGAGVPLAVVVVIVMCVFFIAIDFTGELYL